MIHNSYTPEVLAMVAASLEENGAVILQDFLDAEVVVDRCERVRELDKFSYLYCPVPEDVVMAIVKFVSSLVGRQLMLHSSSLYCFEHGDYTLLHDSIPAFDGITVLYDFTDGDACCVFIGEEEFGFSASANTCVIVQGKYQRYFKYVNRKQKGRKVLVMELSIRSTD